jgi:hypothetical protein
MSNLPCLNEGRNLRDFMTIAEEIIVAYENGIKRSFE